MDEPVSHCKMGVKKETHWWAPMKALFVSLADDPQSLSRFSLDAISSLDVLDLCHSDTVDTLREENPALEINLLARDDGTSDFVEASDWYVSTVNSIPRKLKALAGNTADDLSAWRFSELADKNSLIRPSFRELLVLTAIHTLLKSGEYQALLVAGTPPQVNQCLLSLCKLLHIRFVLPPGSLLVHRKHSRFRCFLTRIHVLVNMFINVIIWKVVRRKRGLDPSLGTDRKLLLVSDCPRQWRDKTGTAVDRYWADLPATLERRQMTKPQWLFSFFLSEHYCSHREFIDGLKEVEKLVCGQELPWIFIEDQLTPLDFLKAAFDCGSVRLANDIHRRKDQLFQWNGISVYPLFRGLINATIYSVPLRSLLMTATQRTTAAFDANLLAMYGFEFGSGRAIISGARRGLRNLKVWGLQHGPIAPGKIFYDVDPNSVNELHIPDKILLDGDFAGELMAKFNFPDKRMLILGPLRFGHVQPADTIKPKENNRKKILIAPGLHDCHSMIQFVAKSLGDIPDIELVIKIHPQSRYEFETSRASKYITKAEYKIERRPVPEVLGEIDLAIVSYSTVGLEALQSGVPVIEIRPDYGIDWGLFSAAETSRHLASTPMALRDFVGREDWTAMFDETSAATLISRVFKPGNVTERYANAFEKELS